MSTTNDGAVIIQADKERFLKLGIKQIRELESEKGLNKPISNIFDDGASFETIFIMFKSALVGHEKLEETDIEDIMDATVTSLENGMEDLLDLLIKSGGGYLGSVKKDESEKDAEIIQQLP